MKKHRIILLALFVISISLQSCFEIKEIIKINKDGSGTFTMAIDMSEVKAMFESFGGGDGETSSPTEGMEEGFDETKSRLELVAGINNIQFKSEFDGYIVSTSFDFESIAALNEGMDIVYENEKNEGKIPEYYSLTKRGFERTGAHNVMDQIKKELGSDDLQVEGMDLTALFSEVKYINTIIFEDQKVKKVRSGNVQISEDGTSISATRYIFKADSEGMEYKLRLR